MHAKPLVTGLILFAVSFGGVAYFKSENSSLRTEVGNLRTEIIDLRSENYGIKTEINDLKAENARLNSGNADLQSEISRCSETISDGYPDRIFFALNSSACRGLSTDSLGRALAAAEAWNYKHGIS